MTHNNAHREMIRASLAAARAEFQDLARQVSPDDWTRKTSSSVWSVGDVLCHLVSSLELLPREIAHARRGKGMYNLPRFLLDPLNAWSTRLGARGQTPASVMQRYEHAYAAAIDLLDQIEVDEWRKGAHFWSEGFLDIEGLFRAQTDHMAEHGPLIREALAHTGHNAKSEERRPLPQADQSHAYPGAN